MQAEELLRDGRLDEALKQLQDDVRSAPASAKHRIFLFQLLCVLGDWDRAITQLNVAADMDADASLMAQVCRPALNAEALRKDIFKGKRSPLFLGEPPEWLAWLAQTLPLLADGKHEAAAELRDRAFEAAPAIPGMIDAHPFEWIADSDPRLGPTLEVIVQGQYYWVPFSHIAEIKIDEPEDLRDLVWVPANFTWTNEGQTVGLIPARYPGSETSDDSGIRLGRKTDWHDLGSGFFTGLGQRMFTTDQAEYPLLQARQITMTQDEQADVQGQGENG